MIIKLRFILATSGAGIEIENGSLASPVFSITEASFILSQKSKIGDYRFVKVKPK